LLIVSLQKGKKSINKLKESSLITGQNNEELSKFSEKMTASILESCESMKETMKNLNGLTFDWNSFARLENEMRTTVKY
jgi:hypothetical protein